MALSASLIAARECLTHNESCCSIALPLLHRPPAPGAATCFMASVCGSASLQDSDWPEELADLHRYEENSSGFYLNH